MPRHEVSLGNTIALSRFVTAAARLDYRGGMRLLNTTGARRCRSAGNCREINDAAAPLADRARGAAAARGLTSAGYVEDASFLKLRELSVALRAPDAWAPRVGMQRLALTVAARNLATWTGYSGTDPESGSYGDSPLVTADEFGQPQVRTLILRLDVTR